MSELNMSKRESTVEVYQAAGEAEALIIKGLLESNGLLCVLRSNAAPSVHVFAIDGMGEVKVMVRESRAEKARRLIVGKSHV